ncbi:hypothetical protein B2G50_11635 [Leptospira interrogans serovar Canicola]|nr:hypothetical protein B2G50_11635 [Leptospira interrogans serovar Canicola]
MGQEIQIIPFTARYSTNFGNCFYNSLVSFSNTCNYSNGLFTVLTILITLLCSLSSFRTSSGRF